MSKNNYIVAKIEDLIEFLREPIYIESFFVDIHEMGTELSIGFIDKTGKPKEFYFSEDELVPLFSLVLKNEDDTIRARGYYILAKFNNFLPNKIKVFEQIILDNYEIDKDQYQKLTYFRVLSYLKTDKSRNLLFEAYNSMKNKTDKMLMSFVLQDSMFVGKSITRDIRNYFIHKEAVMKNVESIKSTLEEQPESLAKNELTKEFQSLADKIEHLLSQDLDRMIEGQKPIIDIERLEKIAKIGRYEPWWKRNLVSLVGTTLTFVVAFIAMVFSWYK